MFRASEPLNHRKYLTETEYEALEASLRRFIREAPRDTCLFLMALYTGARACELLAIEWEDLDLNLGAVLIRGRKGSEAREIPLPPWLCSELARVPRVDPRVFPISYKRLHQLWLYYRTCRKKFHSTRHTFAMRLYDRTKDIRLVQRMLGHRNLMNTMIYAEYSYSLEEKRALMGL